MLLSYTKKHAVICCDIIYFTAIKILCFVIQMEYTSFKNTNVSWFRSLYLLLN